MPVLGEITNHESRRSRANSTSHILFSDDDDYHDEEEEDYDTAVGIKKAKPLKKNQKKKQMYFDDDSEEEEGEEAYLSSSDEEGGENDKENARNDKRKDHPDSIIKKKRQNNNYNNNKDSNENHKSKSLAKPTKTTKKTPNPKPRKRRRSSARFLRLSGRFDDEDEDDDMEYNLGGGGGGGIEFIDGETAEEKQQKLDDMYKHAIRLNVENKINVGNSWGINLIDDMDKFLGDEEEEEEAVAEEEENGVGNGGKDHESMEKHNGGLKKRVNFTKASCTLDASVKIYSYRVDDVHLTSYKFLSNLNRTDGGGGKAKNPNPFSDTGVSGNDGEDEESSGRRNSLIDESKRAGKRATVETLESNLSNINVSKLDSAYDIDPLFHKMSQKFDEGGAKGLLLVNLGVAGDGCRIILDSKEDNVIPNETDDDNQDEDVAGDEAATETETETGSTEEVVQEEGLIDISEVRIKLQELLLCTPLDTVQLVPQLEELRESYAALEEEGFTDNRIVQKVTSKRYANDEEEEKAAVEIIQREALEKSRVGGNPSTSILAPNMSMFTSATSKNTDEDQYAPDNYGGGFDDYDDDDHEDPAFDNFIALDDNADKYASTSFAENEMNGNDIPTYSTSENIHSNGTFLDAVCNSEALNSGGNYNYFDSKSMEKILEGNQWAGSAHWKRRERVRSKPRKFVSEEIETKKSNVNRKRKNGTKEKKQRSLVDFNNCHKCLDSLLKKSERKKNTADKSQFSKAIREKHTKQRNILPQDAAITTQTFTELFLRPGAVVSEFVSSRSTATTKSVGFNHDDMPFDDGVDDSYDDGPGFDLANNEDESNVYTEDYIVKDLDDVRRVDKIKVNHATVAKKVDVKRLKTDLWNELDAKTAPVCLNEEVDSGEEQEHTEKEKLCSEPISFNNVVKEIEGHNTQEDVSLAFYFICVLHLANEKCLKLENGEKYGLNDFVISRDSE